ncbi:MAG: hypothetical protein AAFO06_15930 [Cyanobacteria bacterium J06597_16]
MIDAKSAVKFAREYIQSIQDLLDNPLKNLRLEEVELSEDSQYWLVTLGYDNPDKPRDLSNMSLIAPQLARLAREYKVFQVGSDDGMVKSMKIREV